MPVQAFVSKLAVKAFNKGVLCWLSRLNEAEFYATIPTPEEHRFTGELRPVVTDNGVWFFAAHLNKLG